MQQYNLAGSMGRLPDLNAKRYGHACGKYFQNGEVVSTNTKSIVTLTDNVFVVQVYIVSGGSAGYNSLSSTEILTVGSSEWVEAGALPSARGFLRGVTLTIDNQFYALGESECCPG